jgi:phenylpropionate dioxygenase-like ring-hydroxylating dioxygenase large terminal subunit
MPITWCAWYAVGGVKDDKIRKLARQNRETRVEEDIRLAESVQRGLTSRGYRPGPRVINIFNAG